MGLFENFKILAFETGTLLMSTAVFATSMIAIPASAQSEPILDELHICSDMPEPSARLACFDRTVSELENAVLRRQNENFGLSDYETSRRASEERAEQNGAQFADTLAGKNLHATLIEAATNPMGKRLFILDNGQVWRETNPSTMRGLLREGDAIVVERGFGGAFRLSSERKRGFITVDRVR
jgi:hypothetical protein